MEKFAIGFNLKFEFLYFTKPLTFSKCYGIIRMYYFVEDR